MLDEALHDQIHGNLQGSLLTSVGWLERVKGDQKEKYLNKINSIILVYDVKHKIGTRELSFFEPSQFICGRIRSQYTETGGTY